MPDDLGLKKQKTRIQNKINSHMEGYKLLKQFNIHSKPKRITNVGISIPRSRSSPILFDDINQEIIMNEDILGIYWEYPMFQIFDY